MKPTEAITAITAAARAMVAAPTLLKIDAEHVGTNTAIFIQTSDERDLRRLVGREGRNIDALKALAEAMEAPGQNIRVILKERGPATSPPTPELTLAELVLGLHAAIPSLRGYLPTISQGKQGLYVDFHPIMGEKITRDPMIEGPLETVIRAAANIHELRAFVVWRKYEPAPK